MLEGAAPIRVLLVDDHEVVRVGLRSLLDQVPGIVVAGEAGTVAEAVSTASSLQPDVVVMDVRLPDGNGVDACREIRARRPETRVIMLTSYPDEQALFHAVLAGAAGYLLKQVRATELVDAIRAVHGGRSLLDPALTASVFNQLRTRGNGAPRGPMDALTEQERRILELIAEGRTNRQIATAVLLSEKTVKHYVSSILAKLDVARRSEAAAIWARRDQERKAAADL
jgi:two-component system response regulator DevR